MVVVSEHLISSFSTYGTLSLFNYWELLVYSSPSLEQSSTSSYPVLSLSFHPASPQQAHQDPSSSAPLPSPTQPSVSNIRAQYSPHSLCHASHSSYTLISPFSVSCSRAVQPRCPPPTDYIPCTTSPRPLSSIAHGEEWRCRHPAAECLCRRPRRGRQCEAERGGCHLRGRIRGWISKRGEFLRRWGRGGKFETV